MVETREQTSKDEKRDFKIRIRKRWLVLLISLFVIIPLACWVMVEFVINPVFEKQEITLGAPGVTFEIKIDDIVLEKNPLSAAGFELVLELNNRRVAQEMRIKAPLINQMVYDVIAQEDPESLVTVAGRQRLKRILINRINDEIKSGKIVQIYIPRFTMQKE